MKRLFFLFLVLIPFVVSPAASFAQDSNDQKTQICFWTNDGSDGTITIKLDGEVVGTLTRHWTWPAVPDWGEDQEGGGTLVITTTPGYHTWSASGANNSSWDGNITLTPGQQFTEHLRVTQFCFWTTCGDEGQISITIDGKYVGSLNQHFTYTDPDQTPLFGVAGTLVVTLTAGSHTFYARGQSRSDGSYFYWGPYTLSINAGEQLLKCLR